MTVEYFQVLIFSSDILSNHAEKTTICTLTGYICLYMKNNKLYITNSKQQREQKSEQKRELEGTKPLVDQLLVIYNFR